MNQKWLGLLIIAAALFTVSIVPPTAAQDQATCPAIAETAYLATKEACAETGRDEACYGHAAIQAAPEALEFSAPGDVAKLGEIDGLRLSGMDLDAAEWGIALLRVQANLSDDAPENVEIVLFGDVEIAAAEDAGPEYGPMQAFTFQSGIDDAPCAVAPSSGILIQTPQGVGEITLLVNEAVIELGSTAYLQAQPDDVMTVRVIEGQAKVTAGDETVTVPAGAETTIPLDKTGIASGVPTAPGPYDITLVEALPVSLLSVPVEIALPASGERSENEPGDACAVTPGGDKPVNQRGGPGTNYPVVGQLAPGTIANPDGQATGADGYTWWRLGEGAWVRGDVVLSAGACGSLPQAKAPPAEPQASEPPQPSQPQGTVYGNSATVVGAINVFSCMFSDGRRVTAGRSYYIRMSIGFPNEETARAQHPDIALPTTMNGAPMTPISGTLVEYNSGVGFWEVNQYYETGALRPGVYTIIGQSYNAGGYVDQATCVLTVR